MEKRELTVSVSTILKIVAVLVLVWILWKILDVILLILIVAIIYAALSPAVEWLSAKKIPRILAVTLVYLILIGLIAGIFYIIIPPLVVQVQELAQNMPLIIEKINPSYYSVKEFYYHQSQLVNLLQKPLEAISSQLTTISIDIFNTAQGFFIFLGGILLVSVLTFYLLLEKNSARRMMEFVLPEKNKEKYLEIPHKVRLKWGSWLVGQLLIMFIIGALIYIGLVIMGIPYALPLAVLAGLLEIIPYIGSIVATIPAVIIAFFVSPWLALGVIILVIGIHVLESYVFVPKIMQRAVGLSPVIIIIIIVIGGKLAGLLGVILVVPIAAGIAVLFTEWKKLQNQDG